MKVLFDKLDTSVLDEIETDSAYIHLERMRGGHIWMTIVDKYGRTLALNLKSKSTIHVEFKDV